MRLVLLFRVLCDSDVECVRDVAREEDFAGGFGYSVHDSGCLSAQVYTVDVQILAGVLRADNDYGRLKHVGVTFGQLFKFLRVFINLEGLTGDGVSSFLDSAGDHLALEAVVLAVDGDFGGFGLSSHW